MKRLENGLIDKLEYKYDAKTGMIDWFNMIPREYLYINQDKKTLLEKRLNKPFNQITINEVKETDLVITLQGIRWLLDVRGYQDVDTYINVATQDYAAATCRIVFIPNVESPIALKFSSAASAHNNNTKSFYRNYLVEAASNRALCRAVRNFLKINIVSKEELSDSNDEDNTSSQPLNNNLNPDIDELLNNSLVKSGKNLSWLNTEFNQNWSSISEIPKIVKLKIIGQLKLID